MGNRFKVGDIVKGTHPSRYRITNTKMTKGRVTSVSASGVFSLAVLEHKGSICVGDEFSLLDPQYFELVESSRKFKVGDIIKGTPEATKHYSITTEQMTRGEVTEVCPGGFIKVMVLEHTGGEKSPYPFTVGEEFFELATPTVESLQAEVDTLKERVSTLESAKTSADEPDVDGTPVAVSGPKRLTKGDKVRIKDDAWSREGDIGTIIEDDGTDTPYLVEFADGDTNWYEPHEVEAYAPKADVGAIVKVSDVFYDDKVAKVISTDEDDSYQPIEVKFADGTDYWPDVDSFKVIYESGTPEATALGTYMFQ